MHSGSDGGAPTLGFLTALVDEQNGLLGGYLILNARARPLEFHCTAPLKPSRAQEILYGATLSEYLFGEQLGQVLLNAAERAPAVVCTDLPAMLAVRPWANAPVALVLPASGTPRDDPTFRLDGAQRSAPHLATFRLGRNQLAVESLRAEDQRAVVERLSGPAAGVDLDWFDMQEPFERVRTALGEAQRSTAR